METKRDALTRLFSRVGVRQRHLAVPLEDFRQLTGFEARTRAFTRVAVELGSEAVGGLLKQNGLDARDVGEIVTTTITGAVAPSLDARLMNLLPLPTSVRRVPLFGLGCLGGVAGMARVMDYLRGQPDHLAILLAVELCSLTVQPEDLSMANLISSGLFGDGAAAVMVAGDAHPLASQTRAPRLIDSRSAFFHDTEGVMGWDVVDSGFRVVLSSQVPAIARAQLPPAVDGLLRDHGLDRSRVRAWVSHPGGPKVMDAIEQGLELDEGALDDARHSLATVGNLSSASVLFVLQRWLDDHPPPSDSYGMMIAMGPGFCAELVLLQW